MAPPAVIGGSTSSAIAVIRDYEFKNKSYTNVAFTVFNEMWQNKELCDVVLVTNGGEASSGGGGPGAAKKARVEREIPAHRNVLAAASPFFRRLFSSGFDDATSARAVMQDADGDLLFNITQYMYTGYIKIDGCNVTDMLHLADYLLMTDLKEACVKLLMSALSVSNCFSFVDVAFRYNCPDLEKAAHQFAARNFGKLIESDAILTLTEEQLTRLISADCLCVRGEEEIYKAVIAWVSLDKARRKKALHKLLGQVRLPSLPKEFLIYTVGEEPLIKGDAKCKEIYLDALKYTIVSDCADTSFTARDNVSGWGRDRQFNCLPFPTRKTRWLNASKMLQKRKWSNACSLDGNLFVMGGDDGTRNIKSGEVYKGVTGGGKWTKIADMLDVRGTFGLCESKQKLYLIGGISHTTLKNSSMIYDPLSDVWTYGAQTIEKRAGSAASLEGTVYAAGHGSLDSYSATVEMWDPRTPTWQLTTPMLTLRNRPRLVSAKGKVYAIGGDEAQRVTVESFDVRALAWSHEQTIAEWQSSVYYATRVDDRIITAVAKPRWADGVQVMGDFVEALVDMEGRQQFAFCALDQCLFALGGQLASTGIKEVTDIVSCLSLY